MLNIKERIDVGLTSSGKVISTSRLNIKVKGFKLQVVGLEKGWNWARTETNNQLPTIYEVELVSKYVFMTYKSRKSCTDYYIVFFFLLLFTKHIYHDNIT